MSQLTRWEPFRDLVSLREAMDRLFEESVVRPRSGELAPRMAGTLAIDMWETDDDIVVKTAVPGVNPEDIDISMTGDTLTIRGETKIEEETEQDNYVCREMRYGSFSRSITVPMPVESEKAEAEFEDGMLTLKLPKTEEVKPKSIKVKSK